MTALRMTCTVKSTDCPSLVARIVRSAVAWLAFWRVMTRILPLIVAVKALGFELLTML